MDRADIASLLGEAQGLPGCTVYPPAGLPTVAEGHVLPADIREFYSLCGGITLFADALYAITIVPPEEVRPLNATLLDVVDEDVKEALLADISSSWYTVAFDGNTQRITIDMGAERPGLCYDSDWERHPWCSEIIAKSFTECLSRLIRANGQLWYWLEPDFPGYGSPRVE
jgi:hypothetical protein